MPRGATSRTRRRTRSRAIRSTRSRPTACPGTRRARRSTSTSSTTRPRSRARRCIAIKDTPLPIPVSDCVSDPNHDPVTMDLDGATGGSVERVAGVWRFVPTTGLVGSGSVMIHASDGTASGVAARRCRSRSSHHPGRTRSTSLTTGKTYTVAVGAAVRMAGTAVDQAGEPVQPIWKFSDTKPNRDRHEGRASFPQDEGRSPSRPRRATRPRR